jgi:hypothetical protein
MRHIQRVPIQLRVGKYGKFPRERVVGFRKGFLAGLGCELIFRGL